MTERMWTNVHVLAADLALNQVSKNLVQQAADYIRYNPQASLTEYLDRLERLGDYFTAGKGGHLERADLRRALERVKEWPRDPRKTLLVLGWIARLIEYYTHRPEEAVKQSGISFLPLHPGAKLDGVVRDRDKDMVWVAVGSGQWGRATRRFDAEIGDKVRASVQSVTSPIRFDVDIVAVTQRIAPAVSRRVPQPVSLSKPQEPPQPSEADGEVSDKAKDILAAFQKIWAQKELENGE